MTGGPEFLTRDERLVRRLIDRPLTARRAATTISVVTAILVVSAGALMRVVEPGTYPNVWLGMWWSVQTVTSVGYGDIVPQSFTGRLLAVFVMIIGIAFLTVIVATVSAAFVESSRRRAERTSLAADPVLVELRRLGARLDAMEQRLGAGDSGDGPPRG
jgi:voltage-gated potassium channel